MSGWEAQLVELQGKCNGCALMDQYARPIGQINWLASPEENNAIRAFMFTTTPCAVSYRGVRYMPINQDPGNSVVFMKDGQTLLLQATGTANDGKHGNVLIVCAYLTADQRGQVGDARVAMGTIADRLLKGGYGAPL